MILNCAMDRKRLLSQKDIYGNGPVHLAVLASAPEVLRLLLKFGANRELPNNVRALLSTILVDRRNSIGSSQAANCGRGHGRDAGGHSRHS